MPTQYAEFPQYVPIVKWQKWERMALQKIDPTVAARVLPCIEVRDSKQHAAMLSAYATTWTRPALVDYANPHGDLPIARANELIDFLQNAPGSAALASPVISPLVAPVVFPAIRPHLGKRKVTLRVRLASLDQAAEAVATLTQAMTKVPRLASTTDRLIVDLGETPAIVGPAEAATLVAELAKMKALGFHNLHLASGAFPDSLMAINGAGSVDRRDWRFWTHVAAAAPALHAGFSDYGPLTPKWDEGILTRRGNRSVIRYALDDKWRIIRAATSNTADSIAISHLMVNVYASEFKGPAFSFGDLLIAERADPMVPLANKRCGHYHIAEFWSHHIAHVVQLQY